jgi:hypothetical protein
LQSLVMGLESSEVQNREQIVASRVNDGQLISVADPTAVAV